MIEHTEKLDKANVTKAYRAQLNGNMPKNEKTALIKSFHQNNLPPIIITGAKRIQYNQKIKEYFDRLIKEKKDIKEVLPCIIQ